MISSKDIQLSEHFTYTKLFRFVIPSVIMMACISIYSIVDGLFISNFIGKVPFAAVNLVFPLVLVFGAIGFMIGTGGSAIVGKTLGEQDKEKANGIFSMLIYTTIVLGGILSICGVFSIRPLLSFLGAKPELISDAVSYGNILFTALPCFMLQHVFQNLLVTAGKPKIGLFVTILAGSTNIVLDYIFIVILKLGVDGAAYATAISQLMAALIPIIYFSRKNSSLLHLTRPKLYLKELCQTFINGSSELMTNISSSIVTIAYNYQLLKYIGTDGVAAYGAIMYILFIFASVFMGYCVGTAPIFSFNYGAKNDYELKSITKKSIIIIGSLGLLMTVFAEVFAQGLSKIFVGYDIELLNFTVGALRIFALCFLVCGFNIFGSAFFTALNNGVISAMISFLRALVFEISAVMFLPLIFGVNGIWVSVLVAELLALIVTAICFAALKKKYNY